MTCPRCGHSFDLIQKRGKTSPENRLFHALCAKLAMWRKTSPDLMKRYLKLYAASVHNYPCEVFEYSGKRAVEPKSMADATSEEACLLIQSCYELGLEWGCPLEQPNDFNGGING